MPQLASTPSEVSTVIPTADRAWLKDPLDPARSLPLSCVDNVAWTRTRAQAVLTPLGRPDPVVQTDVRRLRTGDLTTTPATQAEATALDGLVDSTRTMLLQVPPAQPGWYGTHAYVLFAGDDTATALGQVPVDNRTVTVPLVEVRRP